jgi:hypothetical protein
VDGDGPFAGVRPNAGTSDDREFLWVVEDSDVLCIDPTTDSVREGDIVGGDEGTVLRGDSGREVGGDGSETL